MRDPKEHREVTKQMSVWKLPPILIIHLKRLSFLNYIWRDKISKLVKFPLRYSSTIPPLSSPPPSLPSPPLSLPFSLTSLPYLLSFHPEVWICLPTCLARQLT